MLMPQCFPKSSAADLLDVGKGYVISTDAVGKGYVISTDAMFL